MSKQQQLEKNLQLSEELMDYLADNPSQSPTKKGGSISFVVITKDDKELNKLNNKLIDSLREEGKKVMKAIQTLNKKQPWTFSQA